MPHADPYDTGPNAAPGDDVFESFAQATLLIVDDEENILSALRRALRQESYRVLTATSGTAGLDMLRQESVDVVLSDQRMPGMTGVDFLRQARALRPQTVRMVLSGYTELAAVTAAINEGAIYKYLTKPWDDDFLRASIREAFVRKALSDENRRLANALSIANDQLEHHNELLQVALDEQQRRLQLGERLLQVSRDALDRLPVPVLGLDPQGCVVLCNQAALNLGAALPLRIGMPLPEALAQALAAVGGAGGDGGDSVAGGGTPPCSFALDKSIDTGAQPLHLAGQLWQVDLRTLDPHSERGHLITLLPASARTL